MGKIVRFWKVILIDTLGVLCMVLAILTGWLPGPGGIPLFILGLSLLAINHDWAERYIDLLKKYADKLGDIIFVKNKWVELTYDIMSTVGLLISLWLFIQHKAWWMVSLGIVVLFLSLTLLLGNRGRWSRLKKIKL